MRNIISILASVAILTTMPAAFVLGRIPTPNLQPAIDIARDASGTLLPFQRAMVIRT